MEVTSIRLERELKERLKELADNQGYQALIRDILWNFVEQQKAEPRSHISRDQIRATMVAIAQQTEQCWLTGESIQPQESMLLGLLRTGEMVPLKAHNFD
jgi:metal-responsive CopG/Arc/MetJ family transcriptional regulator